MATTLKRTGSAVQNAGNLLSFETDKLKVPTAPINTPKPVVNRPVVPAVNAPVTSAPVATPQVKVADTLAAIKNRALELKGSGEATAGSTTAGLLGLGYDKGPGTIDQFQAAPNEEQIRRNLMKLFQSQIDATNQAYDEILNNERLAGEGRLGTRRAMGARGGILGSDFSESQRIGTQQFNTAQERSIAAEKSAKIGSILGEVRTAAAAEIKEKREARQSGYDNYIKYLTSDKERKADNAQKAASAILAAGFDPSTMDTAELSAIAKEAGLTPQDISYAYTQVKSSQASDGLEDRKTEAEIAKIEADIAKGKIVEIGEGTMLYNTETGETFKNPKTYAPGSSSGLKVGGQTLNQEAVADVHQTLNESRGKDGYANTDLYMQQFNGFVALGGDPKDFIKEYDPNVYINPKDETRSFLQTSMKTTPSEAVQKELTALEQLQQLQEMQANQ